MDQFEKFEKQLISSYKLTLAIEGEKFVKKLILCLVKMMNC